MGGLTASNGNQQGQGISRHVWQFGLHALNLEELPCGMAGVVLGQRQELEHYP